MSVIVPFYGTLDEGREAVAALRGIAYGTGDELILVDNTREGVASSLGGQDVRVVVAPRLPSSYYARNVGAEHAHNEWLLFLDADCVAPADLLDAYFAEAPSASAGAVAGEVVGSPEQAGLIPRYARSRRHLGQAEALRYPYRPFAVTANLLVRREAWGAVGGFLEGVRSGGDCELCWRLQDAGWTLGYRSEAAVEHRHRERLPALARQMARYGAGRAWLNRRYPGSSPRPRLVRQLARAAVGMVVWTVTGRFERALFKGLDGLAVTAETIGRAHENVSSRPAPASAEVVVLADLFPELSETFIVNEVNALRRAGLAVRVEAGRRSDRPSWPPARAVDVHFGEDDGIWRSLVDLAWLVTRHPIRCARDVVERQPWRRSEAVRSLRSLAPLARRLAQSGERHLHAHFAAGAALDALRLSRLGHVTYSVTAHAYDIFMLPRNLELKMREAAFVTTGCRYNVDYLVGLLPDSHRDRVHEIVMGVDAERFTRSSPYPCTRRVLAVGRLIEKKGFEYLVEAVALLRDAGQGLEELTIVGEGPLRYSLGDHARRLGVDGVVRFVGAQSPDGVKAELERADVLAMPCVVAGDGDRDSMPVVVKEALAMEVPVVGTEEVGLPELIRPEWGRLVPPRDARALAGAVAELLALGSSERVAMGAAGRTWVVEHANVDRETEKLVGLIRAALRD